MGGVGGDGHAPQLGPMVGQAGARWVVPQGNRIGQAVRMGAEGVLPGASLRFGKPRVPEGNEKPGVPGGAKIDRKATGRGWGWADAGLVQGIGESRWVWL